MNKGFVIDVETTDAFLDADELRYTGGATIWDLLERDGHDIENLAGLAAAIADRRRAAGLPALPPLPAPADH